MSLHGKIAKWNDEKGFGFIAPSNGGSQVFVHVKALHRGAKRPQVGADVTYQAVKDTQGRLRAEHVRLVDGNFSLGPAVKSFIGSTIFLTFIAALAVQDYIPFIVLWLYLGMSTVSIFMYALDKSAAKKSRQRTPENTLHLLSLLGGWPGAMYAQQLFRHKTRKTSFRVGFWLTLAINISALTYILSPYGAPYLALLRQAAPLAFIMDTLK